MAETFGYNFDFVLKRSCKTIAKTIQKLQLNFFK